MAEAKSIKVWDWPVRLFHWTLVVVIAVAFLSSEEDSTLNQWHVLAGWVAAILVVFPILLFALVRRARRRYRGVRADVHVRQSTV